MTPRQLLSPQARAALFDPPTDVRAIVRHYTFSIEDIALIRQRRRNANRLGFAVHLAYLRFPGRVLGPKETPPAHMLAFIADQLRIDPNGFGDYAQRGETRREHLGELQAYLGVQPSRAAKYITVRRAYLPTRIRRSPATARSNASAIEVAHSKSAARRLER